MNLALETNRPGSATTGNGAKGLSFVGLVRSELYKALRMRAMLIGGILAFAPIILLVVFLFASRFVQDGLANNHPPGFFIEQIYEECFSLIRAFGGLFLIVLTVLIFGQEYQHGTIRIILARGVGRLQLAIAKLLAASLIALATFAVYLVIAFTLLYLALIHAAGAAQINSELPTTFGHDMILYVVSMIISALASVLLAMAATTIGRSLVFGMGVALFFFPADNVLVNAFYVISLVTKNVAWTYVTAYLLGPTLNAMPRALLTGEAVNSPIQSIGTPPLVFYDGTHAVVVTLVYMAVFAAIGLTLARLRDTYE